MATTPPPGFQPRRAAAPSATRPPPGFQPRQTGAPTVGGAAAALPPPDQPGITPTAAPEPERTSWTEEFGRGFSQSVGSAPRMGARAAEVAARVVGATETGDYLGRVAESRRTAEQASSVPPPTVQDFREIDSLGDVGRYAAGGLGSALGSMIGPALGGVAGGIVGSAVNPGAGTTVGAIAGAAAPSYVLSVGEMQEALLAEGVEPNAAAQVAAAVAVPIAGLDVASLGALGRLFTGPARQQAQRALARRVATALATGATVEGATEAAQSALQQGAVAATTGDANLPERAADVVNSAIIGAIAGGVIGAPSGFRPDAPPPPVTQPGGAAAPGQGAAPPPPGAPQPGQPQAVAPTAPGGVGLPPPAPAPPAVVTPAPALPAPAPAPATPPAAPAAPAPAAPRPVQATEVQAQPAAPAATTPATTPAEAAPAPPDAGQQGAAPAPQPAASPLTEPESQEAATAAVTRAAEIESVQLQQGFRQAISGVDPATIDQAREAEATLSADERLYRDAVRVARATGERGTRVGISLIRRSTGAGDEQAQQILMRMIREGVLEGTPSRNGTYEVASTDPFGEGTPEAPAEVASSIDLDAAASRAVAPTPAQAEAGNYRMGHVKLPDGIEIAIETPRGGTRSGVDRDGRPWSVQMPHAYGYFKTTEGAEGDKLDVHVGPDLDAPMVFVIDQLDADGEFDEHKVMLGFRTQDEARIAYAAAFTDGMAALDRIGAITPIMRRDLAGVLADWKPGEPYAWSPPDTEPDVEIIPPRAEPFFDDDVDDIGRVDPPPPAEPGPSPTGPGGAPSAETTIPPPAVQGGAPALFSPVLDGEILPGRFVRADQAIAGTGEPIDVEYRVVEADDLIPSHTDDLTVNPRYPAERQPRDRTKNASIAQVQDIFARFAPALVVQGASTRGGAPIVDSRGVVESGNGRVLAIRKVWNESPERAKAYVEAMQAEGADTSGFRQPVLVRVRTTPLDEGQLRDFVIDANERDSLAMSAAERAMAMKDSVTPEVLVLYRGDDLVLPRNRDFVIAMLDAIMSPTERAAVIGSDGEVSQEGMRRVQEALLAVAYGDPDLVATVTEELDSDIKLIGQALLRAAPQWALMRADPQLDPDLDATPELVAAVKMIQHARRTTTPLHMLVAQNDILSGRSLSPDAEAILAWFFNDTVKFTKPVRQAGILANRLLAYSTTARETVGLFGGGRRPRPELIAEANDAGRRTQEAEQLALAAPAKQPEAAPGDPGGDGTLLARRAGDVEGADAATGSQPPVPDPERVRALTPAKLGELDARARALIAQIAPQAQVETAPEITYEGQSVLGAFAHGIIWVALEGPGQVDSTARHEVIHFLARHGFFTREEWDALAANVARWKRKYRIEEFYSDQPEWIQTEEAIAQAYADWAAGRGDLADGPVRRAFARMRLLFRRVKAAIRQAAGAKVTAHDIFAAIERGEIGDRQPVRPVGRMAGIPDVPVFQTRQDAFKALRQDGSTRDLIAVHNIESHVVTQAADKFGDAVLAPSLAIVPADIGWEEFGNVSLIAPPSLLDPRRDPRVRIYDTDFWSTGTIDPTEDGTVRDTTQEQVEKAGKKFKARYDQIFEAFAEEFPVARQVLFQATRWFGNTGRQWIPTHPGFYIAALNDLVAMRGIDRGVLASIAERFVQNRNPATVTVKDLVHAMSAALPQADAQNLPAIAGNMENRVDELVSNGIGAFPSTDRLRIAGRAKGPRTPETAAAAMFVKDRRPGSSLGGPAGTPGGARATMANPLRSLDEIIANRARLVSELELGAYKRDQKLRSEGLVAMSDSEAGPGGRGFGRTTNLNRMVSTLALAGSLTRLNIRNNLRGMLSTAPSRALVEGVFQYAQDLRAAPTEYFEAKVYRPVKLSEFAAAVVPDTAWGWGAADRLRRAGVKRIVAYDYHDPIDPGGFLDPGNPATMERPEAQRHVGQETDVLFARRQKASQRVSQILDAEPLPIPDDLGWLGRFLITPYHLAAVDEHATPVVDGVFDMNERRDMAISRLAALAEPYFKGSTIDKGTVNKVLELGRHMSADWSRQPVISVTNPGIAGLMMAPGESVTLTARQRDMYIAIRKTMYQAFTWYRRQFLIDQGFGKPGDPSTPREIYALAVQAQTPQEARHLNRVADRLAEIDRARSIGYVPFTRHGDWWMVVTDPAGQRVHAEKIEGGKGIVRRRTGGVRARRLRERLENQYPPAQGFAIAGPHFALDKRRVSTVRDIDMSEMDRMAEIGGASAQTRQEFEDALIDGLRRSGFGTHFLRSSQIRGYSTDFERSISDYIIGISGHLARRATRERINKAVAAVPAEKARLKAWAKEYADYANTPTEEYQKLRTWMFFVHLAGNISSAVINLSQVPLVSFPWLTLGTNPIRASHELSRASKDVLKAFRPRLRGDALYFDVRALPAKDRADMQRLLDEGTLVPQVTMEQMGIAQGRGRKLRGLKAKTRGVVDAAAAMFSAAERFNRMATALAALRLARDVDGVANTFTKSLQGNEIAKAQTPAGDDLTPLQIARLSVQETQFIQGKANRATAMRGFGAVFFQFQQFTQNMLLLQARMAGRYGPRGKRALALQLGLYLLAAGMLGLPGAEDLKHLIEAITRAATQLDVDIEKEMQVFLSELLGGGDAADRLAEAARRGLFRFFPGVEISGRVGLGSPTPGQSLGQDATAIEHILSLAPAGGVPLRFFQAFEAWRNGDEFGAAAAISPLILSAGAGNIFRAYAMSQEGVRARSGDMLLPADTLGPEDVAFRALGFHPTDVARAFELYNMENRIDAGMDAISRSYARAIGRALAQGDQAEAQRLNAEVAAYNRGRPPEDHIRIGQRAISNAVARERFGIYARTRPARTAGARERLREATPGAGGPTP